MRTIISFTVLFAFVGGLLVDGAGALQAETTITGGLGWREEPPPPATGVTPCTDDAWVRDPDGFRVVSGPVASYVVNVGGIPDGVTADGLVAAAQAAAATWNDEVNDCGRPDGSAVSLTFDGTVTGPPFPALDSENQILFSDDSCMRPNHVACTPQYTHPATGDPTGWDIVLDPTFPWGVGVGPWLDIQNIITHELGHVVGLGHVPSDAGGECGAEHVFLTMYPCTWPGDLEKRTLALGDALGVEVVSHDG